MSPSKLFYYIQETVTECFYILLLSEQWSHISMSTKYEKGTLHQVYAFLETAALWVWSADSFDRVIELGFSNRGYLESMEDSSLISSARGLGSPRSSPQQMGVWWAPPRPSSSFWVKSMCWAWTRRQSAQTAVLVSATLPSVFPPFLSFQSRTPTPCPTSKSLPHFPFSSLCSKEADLVPACLPGPQFLSP